jgi:phage terminase large subunit-like protein
VIDAVNAGTLRHLGQASLDIAIRGAVLRTGTDGAVVWSQRNSQTEITALMACTVALGGVSEAWDEEPQIRF